MVHEVDPVHHVAHRGVELRLADGVAVHAREAFGVALDGAPANVLSTRVVAALLEPEGEHAVDGRKVRVVGIPAAARAHDAVAQVHRIAAKEVDLMPGVQRERVPRMSV